MNALLHIDNHLEVQRAGLAVTAGRDARMFARRLRAAIRDNVVSKYRAAELLARLNGYRRRDDPWSLDLFLNDYAGAMAACCRRVVLCDDRKAA